MPGQVVGVKAVGYTQSKRRFPAFIQGIASIVTQVLVADVQKAIGSNANRFMFQDFDTVRTETMSPFANVQAAGGTLAGVSAFVDDVDKAVGVAAIGTGNTDDGGMSGLRTGNSDLTLGTRNFTFECRLSGSTSTALQEYSIIAGFGNNLATQTFNAGICCYFRYARAIDGTKWACITANGSDADPVNPTNTTKFVTGVDFDPNHLHIFKITVTTAGLATFFIDGVQVHQTSTNVPTDPGGTGNQLSIGVRALKSAGTGTERTAFIDYISLASN